MDPPPRMVPVQEVEPYPCGRLDLDKQSQMSTLQPMGETESDPLHQAVVDPFDWRAKRLPTSDLLRQLRVKVCRLREPIKIEAQLVEESLSIELRKLRWGR